MHSHYSNQEKLDFIMECRSSGFSDYQWCKLHGISSSTFYNWTVQLKRTGVELPVSVCNAAPVLRPSQDIVKLEVIDDISLPVSPNPIPHETDAIEIIIGKAIIKISNQTDKELLSNFMTCLGECL